MESLDTKTLDYNYTELKLVDMRHRGDAAKGYYLLSFYDAESDTTLSPVNINNNIFDIWVVLIYHRLNALPYSFFIIIDNSNNGYFH